jgi:hypothetical protein
MIDREVSTADGSSEGTTDMILFKGGVCSDELFIHELNGILVV